jgi:pimeloyl-ACP methyl ester carboxylesterase
MLGWAILYRSRSADGRPVIDSGLVVVPSRRPPRGGFPIVALAHATTGFTAAAAPSRQGIIGAADVFQQLVTRGYAVAETDYEGLGTGGVLQYEVGASAAHSVLDGARAVVALAARVVNRRVVVVGHSEGGHAALWSAQLAPSYAPDLDLRGVVASAPGADLPAIFRSRLFSPETALNVLRAAGAWQQLYRLSLTEILTPAGVLDARRLIADLPVTSTAQPFRPDASRARDWRRIMMENTPGAVPTPVPILILIGTADRQVPPQTNLELAANLRRVGDHVRVEVLRGADHQQTLTTGADAIFAFLGSRLG